MKSITVKTNKELDNITKEYRNQGYNIITFWKGFREMEKGDEIITIEIRK